MSGPILIGVSSGLADPKHVAAIGPAIWEFLAFLDWQTSPDGRLLGGKPISAEQIADRTGRSLDQTYRNLARLDRAGYITRKRTPRGFVISVCNPKKRFAQPSKSAELRLRKNAESPPLVNPQKCGSDSALLPDAIETSKGLLRGRASAASARFNCSHGDCPNGAYHRARLVAEGQGIALPDDRKLLGRWLSGAKSLQPYADEQILAAVKAMIQRDGHKWETRILFPEYVAQDAPKLLRSETNGASTLPAYWQPPVNGRREEGGAA